jgi:hypothetical protein
VSLGSIDSFAPARSPFGLRLCRSIPIGSIPAGNVLHHSANLRLVRDLREGGLRLIDSNFPVLGLRPPLCCVYVAPLPAGSISLVPAPSPFRASSMSLDSHRLHSRQERCDQIGLPVLRLPDYF